MSASPADLLIHPEFRKDCGALDFEDLAELDLAIFRLRRGEIRGLPSGNIFELELSKWIVFYDEETIRGRLVLSLHSLRGRK